MTPPASERARELAGVLARAEALAALVRDHGHPARVVVGRRQGLVRIRTMGRWHPETRGLRWRRPAVLLPVSHVVVREWLGISLI